VLVPWAGSAEDHQTLNVTWLSDHGAAIHLPESELTQLTTLIQRLRAHPDELAELSSRAHSKGDVHRSGAIARLIESVAG
jgi:UDP-N-acetylglucosamine--N-acetylmuramyl-(pentapeptide) pyrophosphoryl-undecaprenol N-acetylglucosamine transferase